jgi:fimbrial chaperone protein
MTNRSRTAHTISPSASVVLRLLAGLFALTMALSSQAATFRVNPIRVTLSGGSTSALLTLTNESDKTVRFQVSSFAWSQDPAGEMKLEETDDILFFPALLSLGAKEERNVRIGYVGPGGTTERTYRLFFEELPPAPEAGTVNESKIQIVTKLGVPVFVPPARTSFRGRIDGLALDRGKLRFSVQNDGNTHFVAQSIRITGRDESGGALFSNESAGWYVLAGTGSPQSAEIPPDVCGRIRRIEVEVQTDIDAAASVSRLTGTTDVSAAPCAG